MGFFTKNNDNTIRRTSAWLAVLAVLLMSLMPTMSSLWQRNLPHADSRLFTSYTARSTSTFWMDICGVVVNTQASDAGHAGDIPGPQPVPHDGAAHCPYCLMHANAVIDTPHVMALPVLALTLYLLRPALFYQSPQPLFAWTVAHSRAPPSALHLL